MEKSNSLTFGTLNWDEHWLSESDQLALQHPDQESQVIWTKEEIDSLKWIRKLPAEIRNMVYEEIISTLEARFNWGLTRKLKDNISRIGVVVLDQLDSLASVHHNPNPNHECTWFEVVDRFSDVWHRKEWHNTCDSVPGWAVSELIPTLHPDYREEFEDYLHNSRVYELTTSSWFGYDPQGWLRDLQLDFGERKNFQHLAFDYLSPSALNEVEEEEEDDDMINHLNDPAELPDHSWLRLCNYIASNRSPKTMTLWLRFAEDEIFEILEEEDERWNTWSSAIRGLNVRYNFQINLFVLRNERTPDTPKEYAEMCVAYAEQLRKHLMPHSLRTIDAGGIS